MWYRFSHKIYLSMYCPATPTTSTNSYTCIASVSTVVPVMVLRVHRGPTSSCSRSIYCPAISTATTSTNKALRAVGPHAVDHTRDGGEVSLVTTTYTRRCTLLSSALLHLRVSPPCPPWCPWSSVSTVVLLVALLPLLAGAVDMELLASTVIQQRYISTRKIEKKTGEK